MGHGPVPFFAGRSFSEDLGHTCVESVWKHKSLHCVSVRIFFNLFIFATPHSLWDLSSLTRD